MLDRQPASLLAGLPGLQGRPRSGRVAGWTSRAGERAGGAEWLQGAPSKVAEVFSAFN